MARCPWRWPMDQSANPPPQKACIIIILHIHSTASKCYYYDPYSVLCQLTPLFLLRLLLKRKKRRNIYSFQKVFVTYLPSKNSLLQFIFSVFLLFAIQSDWWVSTFGVLSGHFHGMVGGSFVHVKNWLFCQNIF